MKLITMYIKGEKAIHGIPYLHPKKLYKLLFKYWDTDTESGGVDTLPTFALAQLFEILGIARMIAYDDGNHTSDELDHRVKKGVSERISAFVECYVQYEVTFSNKKWITPEYTRHPGSLSIYFSQRAIQDSYSESRRSFYERRSCFVKEHRRSNKVYYSRTAPQHLRLRIFERDNFTCKICGKHKDNFTKEEWLEADHIHAWEDGGQTTFKNLQTVCNKCNIAKHIHKKFKQKINQFV